MSYVQTGLEGVTVESVDTLYAEYKRMDVPDYYAEGEENPYEGRVRVIPRKAAVYAMVPEKDESRLCLARAVLKGLAKRKRIHEVVCEKHEINYNQFAHVGRIVVLYV